MDRDLLWKRIIYLYRVRKAFIYILLPIFLFGSLLDEVFKVPLLFTHFREHRQRDNNINLLDFLAMHYFDGNDRNDQDQDRDMQLPFKHLDDHLSFEILVLPLYKTSFENGRPFILQRISPVAFHDFNVLDPALVCVFRPPWG